MTEPKSKKESFKIVVNGKWSKGESWSFPNMTWTGKHKEKKDKRHRKEAAYGKGLSQSHVVNRNWGTYRSVSNYHIKWFDLRTWNSPFWIRRWCKKTRSFFKSNLEWGVTLTSSVDLERERFDCWFLCHMNMTSKMGFFIRNGIVILFRLLTNVIT